METYIHRIYDGSTGEISEIPLSNSECAEINAAILAAEERAKITIAAAEKKDAVLEALAAAAGLNVEEVKEALNV